MKYLRVKGQLTLKWLKRKYGKMLTVGEFGQILYITLATFCKSEIINNKNYHDKNFKDVQDAAQSLAHKCSINYSFQIFYTYFQMQKQVEKLKKLCKRDKGKLVGRSGFELHTKVCALFTSMRKDENFTPLPHHGDLDVL